MKGLMRRRRTTKSSHTLIWLLAVVAGLWAGYRFTTGRAAESAASAARLKPAASRSSTITAAVVEPQDIDAPQRVYIDDPIDSIRVAAPETSRHSALSPEALLSRAASAMEQGQWIVARTEMNAALANLDQDDPRSTSLRRQLSDLNQPIFFGADVLPDDPYAPLITVHAADTLDALARHYQIPLRLLQRVNPGITARRMRAGTSLKMIRGPFNAIIHTASSTLDLYCRDLFVCSSAISAEEASYAPHGVYAVSAIYPFTPAGDARYDTASQSRATTVAVLQRPLPSDLAIVVLYAGTGAPNISTGFHVSDNCARQLSDALVAAASWIKITR